MTKKAQHGRAWGNLTKLGKGHAYKEHPKANDELLSVPLQSRRLSSTSQLDTSPRPKQQRQPWQCN